MIVQCGIVDYGTIWIGATRTVPDITFNYRWQGVLIVADHNPEGTEQAADRRRAGNVSQRQNYEKPDAV